MMDFFERIKTELLPATDIKVEALKKEIASLRANGFPSESYEEFNQIKEKGDLLFSLLAVKGLELDKDEVGALALECLNERSSKWTDADRLEMLKLRQLERDLAHLEQLQTRLEKQLFVI